MVPSGGQPVKRTIARWRMTVAGCGRSAQVVCKRQAACAVERRQPDMSVGDARLSWPSVCLFLDVEAKEREEGKRQVRPEGGGAGH